LTLQGIITEYDDKSPIKVYLYLCVKGQTLW